MSDFLTAIRANVPRKPLSVMVGDQKFDCFFQFPDDAALIIFNDVIRTEREKLRKVYDRNPTFAKQVTAEEWTDAEQRIWNEWEGEGENRKPKLPETWSEYRSYVDAMKTAVLSIIHLVLRDEKGNYIVDVSADSDVIALQHTMTLDSGALIDAMGIMVGFIVERNELYAKKKSQKVP